MSKAFLLVTAHAGSLRGTTRRFVRYDAALNPRRRPRVYRCRGYVDAQYTRHYCQILLSNRRQARCAVCEIEHRVARGEIQFCVCGEMIDRTSRPGMCGDCCAAHRRKA